MNYSDFGKNVGGSHLSLVIVSLLFNDAASIETIASKMGWLMNM
jgi:hypothetical protein